MFQNRYVQLFILWLVIAIVFYILIFLLFMALGFAIPTGLQVMVSALGAGYVVYQFFSQRIG